MKKFTQRFFLALAAFLLTAQFAAANKVYVKGRVTFPNGTPVAGWGIFIQTDSTSTPNCYDTTFAITNADGFFSDSLECSAGTIWKVKTSASNNCLNTQMLVFVDNVVYGGTRPIVERPFQLGCNPPGSSCQARFTWERMVVTTPGISIRFNSASSTTGSPTDSIISRFWTFGDGSSLQGNVPTPVHVYSQSGVYTACLRIRTASGCVDSVCNTVTLAGSSNTCRALFLAAPTAGPQIGLSYMQFNSMQSTATAPDSIQSRSWTFGDGTRMDGNNATPIKGYANAGTYTVCLKIRSFNGCMDSICKQVVVGASPLSCQACFTKEQVPNAAAYSVRFNSACSQHLPTDSIVSRDWKFGDGSGLSGNVINPLKQYQQPGTYTVCLKTRTARGCVDSTCQPVTVVGNAQCNANFVWQANPTIPGTNGTTVFFNSTSSTSSAGDSIISRTWRWNDGTPATSGNIVSPTHVFAQPGTYNVCLFITSSRGCRDSICKPIVVAPIILTCRAVFTSEITNTPGIIRFNSAASIGDSITTRFWRFGDGSSLSGNTINPLHTYTQSGIYNVCLFITTARGCRDSICLPVTVLIGSRCQARFTTELVARRAYRFNSSTSATSAGDSIVTRFWSFGNGQTLGGNQVNTGMQYAQPGIYNVCLRITTARGCVDSVCNMVVVPRDSINGVVRIITVSPNPATTQVTALIWSAVANVPADIAIYDVYGIRKLGVSRNLTQGNNTQSIPVSQLLRGPYILRVTTSYGVQSRTFFKL